MPKYNQPEEPIARPELSGLEIMSDKTLLVKKNGKSWTW